jgi:hypothetical protein
VTGARLPAHLEVAALIRAAEVAGGFGTVIARGERDAGVILVLTIERGGNAKLWERLPRLDGRRVFEMVRAQNPDNADELGEYLGRRRTRDRDIWIVELDVANPERLVAEFAR